MNAYWMATIKPLVELLRMRHSPVRWDFGMRYLDRDLPPSVYDQVRDWRSFTISKTSRQSWQLRPRGVQRCLGSCVPRNQSRLLLSSGSLRLVTSLLPKRRVRHVDINPV